MVVPEVVVTKEEEVIRERPTDMHSHQVIKIVNLTVVGGEIKVVKAKVGTMRQLLMMVDGAIDQLHRSTTETKGTKTMKRKTVNKIGVEVVVEVVTLGMDKARITFTEAVKAVHKTSNNELLDHKEAKHR